MEVKKKFNLWIGGILFKAVTRIGSGDDKFEDVKN